MKKLLAMGIFLLIVFTTPAQTRLTVLVKADTPSAISKVDFMNFEQTHSLQSAYTDSILFEFPSTGVDVYNLRFHKNGKLAWQQIWLDTGKITIRGRVEQNKLLIDTVIGSPMYNNVNKYYQQLSILNQQHDTAVINDYLINAYSQHLKNSFSGIIGAAFLRKNGHKHLEIARLYSLVALQTEKVKKHPFVQSVVTSINSIMAKEPLNFEGYSFFDLNNRPVQILFDKANYYILDLWYTACKPCVQQHHNIASNLSRLDSAGITLIGISADSKHTTWKSYLGKNGYHWNNYRVNPTRDWIKGTGYTYFPSYIILDKDKKLLAYYGHFKYVLEYFKLR